MGESVAHTRPADPILSVQNLSISDGDKLLLSGVSFSCFKPELVALIGPMGSGKSLLIRAIAGANSIEGLARSDEGLTIVNTSTGKPMTAIYIPQKIRETIENADMSHDACSRRIEEIAEALKIRAAPLLIDEPTSGLFDDDRQRILGFLEQISVTRLVLMITHHKSDVLDYCDRVLLMAGGRLVFDGSSHDYANADADSYAGQHLRSGGVIIAGAGSEPTTLDHSLREVPSGFDAAPADMSGGQGIIIQPGVLVLRDVPFVSAQTGVDLTGLEVAAVVVSFDFGAALIQTYEGTQQIVWENANSRPEVAKETILNLVALIKEYAQLGQLVVLNTHRVLPALAVTLGTYLVSCGFTPQAAIDYANNKLPRLHIGMRVEQFLWDIELELHG